MAEQWDEHGRLIDDVVLVRFPEGETDYWGNFVWDFRIEGDDESQVRLERSDDLNKGKLAAAGGG